MRKEFASAAPIRVVTGAEVNRAVMAAITCITLPGRNFGSPVCVAVKKHFHFAKSVAQTTEVC